MRDIYFLERDPFAPIRHCYPVTKVLYETKSEYQEIMVIESPYFGKVLVLDGVAQFDEKFEFIYHEFMAHVPVCAHPKPDSVLIIGGGDGGVLREVLKHPEVKRAVLVDIDREVIETSKKFFPTLAEAFNDKRAEVLCEDGFKYMQDHKNEFDIIIIDSTDPVGIASSLTTEQFFKFAYDALKEDGIYVAQTESIYYHLKIVREVQHELRKVFPIVDLYTTVIPGYAGYWWTMSVGSKKHPVREPLREIKAPTKLYSADMHRHAFLPQSFYQRLLSGQYNP